MIFSGTNIDGCVLIRQEPFSDERGYFSRIYCENEFRKHGIDSKFVQSNICMNELKHTLRGLHTQADGFAEDKLVICTRGRVYDVCADVRQGSPTYGKHFGIELSEENGYMLLLPKGCAHGYLTLDDKSQLLYFMSEFYVPGEARGFRFDEPLFSIEWPVEGPYLMSEQDKLWGYIKTKEEKTNE